LFQVLPRVDYGGPAGPRTFGDSRDVSRWLAEAPRAHECFARQAFRYFSGYRDDAAETAFVAIRAALPADAQRDLFRLLVAYAASPLFVERRDDERARLARHEEALP
jgi:hypothetical protein